MNLRIISKPILFVFILPFILISIWFRNGNIMGGGESALPFYNLERYSEITKYSWTDVNLGNANGIIVASNLTYKILSLIENFKIPGFVIEAFIFYLILLISGLSVYFLTKEIFPNLENRFLLLSTIFYWFNPFSLVNVWNRFLYSYMIFWAFLPLFILLYIKGFKRKDYRFSLVVSLSSLIFSYSLTSPVFNIIYWIVITYTTIFYIYTTEGKRAFYLKYFLLTIVGFVLVNFWWIGQFLSFTFSSSYTSSVSEFFTQSGNLSNLSSLSQLLGKLVNTIRFLHGTFFIDGPLWARIYIFPIFIIIEFLFSGLIFWTIFRWKQIIGVLFFGILFIVSIFLIKGTESPFGEIYKIIFFKIPSFQVFRNPFEKFGFLLPITISPLLAYGVSRLFVLKIKPVYKKIIAISLLIIMLLWSFPYWTGLVFTTNEGIDKNQLRSYEVNVPFYYKEANSWLNKNSEEFRFISLPLGGEGITYKWPTPYSGVELSSTLFDIPNISFNTSIPYYNKIVEKLEELFLSSKYFGNIVSLLNVKYLVVRNDIDWKARSMRNPDLIKNYLNSIDNYKKEVDFGSLSIYSLPFESFTPKIWVSNLAIEVSPEASIEDFLTAKGKKGQVLVQSGEFEGSLFTQKNLLKPSFVNVILKKENFITKDALARLLYAKYLPDDPQYKIILIKENLERQSIPDINDRFIFDLTHLGKRAVEIYQLLENGSDQNILENSYNNYYRQYQKLKDNYPDKFIPNPSNQYWKLLIDEFSKHLLLFSQIPQKLNISQLKEDMVNIGLVNKYSLPLGKVDSNQDSWRYRFNVEEQGVYKLFLENENWQNFYEDPFPLQMQLDDKIIEVTNRFGEDGELLEVGLEKGTHELYLSNPVRKDLIDDQSEIVLDSEILHYVSFEVDPFDPFSQYEVSFDFWIKKGEELDFLVYHDNDKEENRSVIPGNKKKLSADEYYHDFRNETFFFSPRKGASSMKLAFKVEAYNDCKKQLKKIIFAESCDDSTYTRIFDKKTEVVIRNISLKKVFDNDLFLMKENKIESTLVPKISYQKITPAEYKVSVRNAENPYILVFSELFNSGWQARFDDGKSVDDNKHFLVNAYANGWVVDKSGDYEITLKFIPQDLLDIGTKVSLISVIAGFVILGVTTWKRKKHQEN